MIHTPIFGKPDLSSERNLLNLLDTQSEMDHKPPSGLLNGYPKKLISQMHGFSLVAINYNL